MKVSIFGGANPQSGGNSYEEAFSLGNNLARAGHVVLTGGYIGTMEAASRGAAEAGGHVIGVTCKEIEVWRGVTTNPWVMEEWHYETLHERLVALIDGCDAAIALPGGVGTLLEIAMLWNRMIVDAVPRKPLILVGDGWLELMNNFFTAQDGYVTLSSRALITFAHDCDEAFLLLQNHEQVK
ncbi:MAG: LOG family protein [Anaerolineaceae bacterium]|nr:LOG family protein [Anaerolineaceae bacterium]